MAGEFTCRVTHTFVIGSLSIGGTVQTILCDQLLDVSKTLPDDTNIEIDVAFPIAGVQVVAIEANHDCTLMSNDPEYPDDTLDLKANQALSWAIGEPDATRLFTVDVTKLYVTTTVSTALKIGVGLNVFPSLD